MPLLPSPWSRSRSEAARAARYARLPCLDTHPNRAEILDIRDRAPLLRDIDVTRLAVGWRNTPYLAAARARALTPDSPLIVEVLAAFDGIDAAFDNVLARQPLAGPAEPSRLPPPATGAPGSSASPTALHASVVDIALKAVRDALAAAYARPVLRRAEYGALIAPWRRVFPADARDRA